jgi:fibronectin-binding autotransporter adhesin
LDMKRTILSLTLMLIIFLSFEASAQTTYYSRNGSTFDWGTNGTWATGSHAGASCGCVPGATDIAIIGNGHTVTYASTATLRSVGSIIVNDGGGGTLTFGNGATATTLTVTGDITMNASGTLQSGATGATLHTLQVAGNISNAGTLNLTAGAATNQTIIFNNTTARTISGAGAYTFRNVRMNTGSSSNININSSIIVNGTIDWLTNGLLVVNSSSNITLGSAAVITSPNTSRYIQLDGLTGTNSNLIKTSNGTTASWQITYPIGTSAGGYTPIIFGTVAGIAPTNGATLSVKAIYNNSNQGQLRRVHRMVIVGNVGATTFTGPQFSYNSATDVSSGDALANYSTIWHLSATTGSWTSPAGTAPGAGAFTVTTPSHNLVTGTYYYTIGQISSYPNTWYSYQTGVWSNWQNWTSDPSGSSLVNALM